MIIGGRLIFVAIVVSAWYFVIVPRLIYCAPSSPQHAAARSHHHNHHQPGQQQSGPVTVAGDSRCEAMRIPWCLGAYDSVQFPNAFGHKNQEEAYYAMHKLWPLIQSGCSDGVGTYLCRLYAPQCPYLVRDRGAEYGSYYYPDCQQRAAWCWRVKRDCERVMFEYGIRWPDEIDCDRLRISDNRDCDGRPTVEVKPTSQVQVQQPAPGANQDLTWSVETVSAAYRTTTTARSHVFTTTPRKLTTTTTTPRTTTTAATPETTVASTGTNSSSTQPADRGEPAIATTAISNVTRGYVRTTTTTPTSRPKTSTIASTTPEATTTTTEATTITTSSISDQQTTPIVSENPTAAEVVDGADSIEQEIEGWADNDTPIERIGSSSSGESSDEIRFRPAYRPSASKCEPLTIPSCQNLGYNATNIDEEMQNLAAIQLFYFSPLLEVKCSDYLQSFLCAAYTPPCARQSLRPPCRNLCISAKSDCAELMEKVGFRWPEELECGKYPTNDEGNSNDDQCIAELTLVEGEDDEGDYENMPIPISIPADNGDIDDTAAIMTTAASAAAAFLTNGNTDGGKCRALSVELCRGLNTYNETYFPNIFSHPDQSTAEVELIQFQPLIDVNCAADIRLFLCATYFPPCIRSDHDYPKESIILPCRGLCESVKSGCAPLLDILGFEWPKELNCDQFPHDDDNQANNTCTKSNRPIDDNSNVDKSEDHLITKFTQTKAAIDTNRARLRAFEALKNTAPLNPSCEPLSPSSVCYHGSSYDSVFLPNLLHHTTQQEAALEMVQFKPVLDSKCAGEFMQPFLCALYAPMCTVLDHPLPPCRELCSEARTGCESVMLSYGFRWPEHFNCSQFPSIESDQLCVMNNNLLLQSPSDENDDEVRSSSGFTTVTVDPAIIRRRPKANADDGPLVIVQSEHNVGGNAAVKRRSELASGPIASKARMTVATPINMLYSSTIVLIVFTAQRIFM